MLRKCFSRKSNLFKKAVSIISLIIILNLTIHCSPEAKRNKLPGFLYLRLNSNPTTLDPALIVDVSTANLATKIFNGLVRFNENMEVIPDIARSFKISPDGRNYCFTLRTDVRFSNGRRVSASDFKYSFERILHPKTGSPRTWVFSRVEGAKDYQKGKTREVSGIRVRSQDKLEIVLVKPFALFLQFLALPTAYCVPREEVEKWKSDFGFHPVGTGPFILSEWRHNLSLKMTANPYYFGDKPKLKGIIYRIIPEDLTALYEFTSGNLDMLTLPQAEYHRFISDPQWKPLIKESIGLNTYYLGVNCQKTPFDNLKVRQAINYAINRKKILTTLFEERGELASSPVPKALLKMKESEPRYPYDPDKACSLLKEAGYPHGFEIKIYQSSDQETLEILEVIQHYLAKVGIRAKIIQREWSSFKEALNQGEADCFWLSWWADYPDAENFLYPTFHSENWGAGGNRTFFKNKKVDFLIEEAQQTMDLKRRLSLYQQIVKIIIEEAPWVSFWHKKDYLLTQPWIKGAMIYPLPGVDKGTSIAID